ncbi:MAG TPA: MoaD/ThiS family protein [Tahibacter sp.]|uniref:MoaD/ThiS family protein n=1 Tax=Tahibacter sp. TaxID=2056211 RepID=UPI002CF3C3B0|nr:MoaD/ThiS family protein [Tahibacter sp.]HSX59951.1 MoaD/ThiS family protein [Tahibacter sp.]
MPTLVLASALARWLPDAGGGEYRFDVEAATVADALAAAFARYPPLRGYVVDEQGAIRHHVAVFVDGEALRDKSLSSAPALTPRSEIYLLQALSGG